MSVLYLRCTKKLIAELARYGHSLLDEPDEIPVLHEWYGNVFRIERRKCCIFTQATTLFSFFVPGLTKPDFVNLPATFYENLDLALRAEGYSLAPAETDGPSRYGVGFLRTNSRSVLASMNDIVLNTRATIEVRGGLARCDLRYINYWLNRKPMGALNYADPIEAFAEALVEHGPQLDL